MIKINKLREWSNANRFGVCTSCGKTPEEDKEIVRIRFANDNAGIRQGTSICLCSECLKILQEKIAEER